MNETKIELKPILTPTPGQLLVRFTFCKMHP